MKSQMNKLVKVGLIIVGAFILCYMGFYNNYPLVYPDTGTYISSGFWRQVPSDRPITYGLFIRHISLAETTWLVIFSQGIIVSYLIWCCIAAFYTGKNRVFIFLFSIVLLVSFSGLSVNTSQLIPDIFTPVMIMCLLLLMLASLNKKKLVSIIVLAWLSIIMHNSHLVISAGIVFSIFIVYLFDRSFSNIRKIITCVLIVILSWLTVPTIHYLYGGGFVYSKGSHLFLMNRLTETGILDDYLKENCNGNNFKLCAYQNQIPTDFIWSVNESPVYKTGGWDANKEEYEYIISDILSSPFYLKKLIVKSLTYTAKQFFSFNTGDTPVQDKTSSTYGNIKIHFPSEIREFELAFQQRRNHWLDYSKKNHYFPIIFLTSIVFIIGFYSKLSPLQRKIILFLLFALLINAAICANLSTVVARYQSRISWLLPFFTFLFFAQMIKRYIYKMNLYPKDKV